MAEEFGIVELKEVVTDLAKFGLKIETALADGKFSWAEGFSMAFWAGPKAFEHIGDAEQIKAEYQDLSEDELEQLVDHLAVELDLANETVEGLIEAGIEALEALYKVFLRAKEAVEASNEE